MKVVVCTPTRNRRWTYQFSRDCLEKQIEKDWLWIIVDNSDEAENDWSVAEGQPKTEYHKIEGRKPIGYLRNQCIDFALKHDFEYLVFWDDDDFYPPTRISSGIRELEKHPEADISGTSELHILLTQENIMMKAGPFHDKHGTAATQTIRRRYVEKNRFSDDCKKGEELIFTKGWTANYVQVPTNECIVVMGHSNNTVNKSEIYKHQNTFRSKVVNDANGRMYFRSHWDVNWELWKKTFLNQPK